MSVHSSAVILFVDDNDASRHPTAEILRQAGFDVWEAATGGEGMLLVQRHPDLVILDVCLPDVSGFEVCRSIRAEPATASIPVLHLSGIAGSSEDRTHGLEGGADGYLLKPVDPAELIAQVRALLRLRRSEQSLAALSRKLLQVQEAERRHIAHELHDEIGQSLSALKISLYTGQHLPPGTSVLPLLAEAEKLVDQVLQQVRSLSLDLRPPMIDDLGLAAALRWLVKRLAESTGLRVRLEVDAFLEGLSAEVEMACFRLVQEVLNNAVKHARASSASVELGQEGNELCLVVHDNGRGFDVTSARRRSAQGTSLGLLGMEERVRLLGGRLTIRSTMSEGTEVRVRIPLGPAAVPPLAMISEGELKP